MRLRVDWAAVEMLEAQWGSLADWVAELQKGSKGAMFRAVGDGVAACARDLPVDARSLMDLARITEYAEALMAALIESGLWKDDDEGNPPGATTAPSLGNSSGTTTSSGGESTLNGSGA